MSPSSCLISAPELEARLGSVRLLDARSGEGGRLAYAQGHLRGAVHADLDRHLAAAPEPSGGGRHPLPEPAVWAARLGTWGIGPQTEVVVYDDQGGANAAARCWWMLRSVGHRAAFVLDGGFQAALDLGLEIESSPTESSPTESRPTESRPTESRPTESRLTESRPLEREPLPPYPLEGWRWPIADADEVERRCRDGDWRVLDVRDETRFRGESEPFDPVAGHIPGARNLPYRLNLGADGRFKSAGELRELYRETLAATPGERVIVQCGSGVTACHTLLALEAAGITGGALYVGSWSDWCQSGRPVAGNDEI